MSLGPFLIACFAACSAPAEETAPADEAADEAEDPLTVGWRAEREGERARAAAAYREATVADPSNARAFVALARVELRAGRPETAASAAERAVELLPESADAHELLGRARLARNEAELAVTALARALELDPERARLHFPLARAYERAQQLDEAVAAYRASAEAGELAARSFVSAARIDIDRSSSYPDSHEATTLIDRAEEIAGEDPVVRAAIERERGRIRKRDREGDPPVAVPARRRRALPPDVEAALEAATREMDASGVAGGIVRGQRIGGPSDDSGAAPRPRR